MDALQALHTRNSVNLLSEPGPTAEQLDNIIKAGLRACAHHQLRRWQYLLIEGETRQQFGELIAEVKGQITGAALDQVARQNMIKKAFRAPTILVVAANIQAHPEVPEIEQLLSAGASAQMMITAAHAQGLGAIWRSGDVMFQESMREGLGLAENAQIIAFIYLGTPLKIKPLADDNPANYLSVWQA